MIAKRRVLVLLIAVVTGSVVFVLGLTPALAQPELEFGIGGSDLMFPGGKSSATGFASVLHIKGINTPKHSGDFYTPCEKTDTFFPCDIFFMTGTFDRAEGSSWVFKSGGFADICCAGAEDFIADGPFTTEFRATLLDSPGQMFGTFSSKLSKDVLNFFGLKDLVYLFPLDGLEFEFDCPLGVCPSPPGPFTAHDIHGKFIVDVVAATVPEPSSVLLFLSALLPTMAVPMLRRRRLRPIIGYSRVS